MPIDSRQKRMSALCPGSPWRGPLVDAAESGFSAGNRQAAAFLYSGIVSTVTGLLALEQAIFRRMMPGIFRRMG